MIDFGCACGRRFRVPESRAGARGRCPACRRLVDVPAFVPAAPTGRLRAGLGVAEGAAGAAVVAAGVLWSVLPPGESAGLLPGAALATYVLFPLALPALASRRGCLSVGRWVALAGAGLAAGAVGFGASFLGGFVLRSGDEGLQHRLGFAGVAASFGLAVAAVGCLVAAAVHPKT